MSSETAHALERAIAEVVKRANADPSFCRLALRDGRSALTQVSNQAVPGNIEVRFIKDKSGTIRGVVLPISSTVPDELTEDDLGQAAGGCTNSCGLTCSNTSILV